MRRPFVEKLAFITTACMLALLMAFTFPLRVFAQASDTDANNGKYISEVKVGMGRDAAAAAAALDGYTILSDENKAFVDLNQSAGGGFASKGEKVVYLGFKTTNESADAITDLAVMNMKGGYSVQEYEALMDTYVKEQIDPLLDRLCAAIEEYRVNYSSQNESNRLRAKYIHDALNKLIDDDTGKGLGDLLLNRTKYEMGDEAYEALSDIQKSNTADIVTIFAQSNGAATLLIENLLARAADTGGDTWLDRFAAVTYDDMIANMIGGSDMFPTDAETEFAKLYDDDAKKILAMWDDFSGRLSLYDEALELLDGFDMEDSQQKAAELDEFIKNFDREKNTGEELDKAIAELYELLAKITEMENAVKTIAVYDYLDQFEYGNGTLADFFSTPSVEVSLKDLYPVAASFSEGQRAGLDFISLIELAAIAITDGTGYSDAELDKLQKASVYDGVDREIYQRGGVALTSDAIRDKAASLSSDESLLGIMTYVSYGLTAASFIAMCASVTGYARDYARYSAAAKNINQEINFYTEQISSLEEQFGNDTEALKFAKIEKQNYENQLKELIPPSRGCKYLSIGFGVATAVFLGLSAYMTYRDLQAYYKVEFTPIPHYMVDEKDITVYNAKGERKVLKNQTAYYKAVDCNRTEADEMFGSLGTCADLGGDVGRQWLALYAAKNEVMAPILAESLKAVVGSSELPANYTTGIHMFGSGSAANLNDPRFVWNAKAPSVYVYFSADDAAKRTAVGSIFADSSAALAGTAGVVAGILGTLAVIALLRKKREEEEQV